MARKQSSANLEQSLDELEKLVIELERGEVSLEDALKHFERGVTLARNCQQALQEAEQKVTMLVGDKWGPLPETSPPPTEPADASE